MSALSLTALEILENLDNLDEETNFSFSRSRSRSRSRSQSIIRHKSTSASRPICIDENNGGIENNVVSTPPRSESGGCLTSESPASTSTFFSTSTSTRTPKRKTKKSPFSRSRRKQLISLTNTTAVVASTAVTVTPNSSDIKQQNKKNLKLFESPRKEQQQQNNPILDSTPKSYCSKSEATSPTGALSTITTSTHTLTSPKNSKISCNTSAALLSQTSSPSASSSRYQKSPVIYEDYLSTSDRSDDDHHGNTSSQSSDEEKRRRHSRTKNCNMKPHTTTLPPSSSIPRGKIQLSKKEHNPTGMVISAPHDLYFAKEAILDPTWLDSFDDEEEDKEEVDEPYVHTATNNKATASVSSTSSSKLISDAGSTASSKSISLASSLSVGSCGFGNISLSGRSCNGVNAASAGCAGSLSTASDSSRELSYADVVDMGVTSVSGSCDGSQGYVLDYLYQLEKVDFSTDSEHSDCETSDVEQDQKEEKQKQEAISEEHNETVEEGHKEVEEKSAYLPLHLMTPPRVKRQSRSAESLDNVDPKPDDDDGDDDMRIKKNSKKECELYDDALKSFSFEESTPPIKNITTTMIDEIPPVATASTDANLNDATPSENTDVCSNTSPCEPISLDSEGLMGIVRGDCILSILDCPGKKTRKKRESKTKSGRKKKKVNGGMGDDYNWASHSVKNSVNVIRELRLEDSNYVSYHDFCKSSLSPDRTGRSLMLSQSPSRDNGAPADESSPRKALFSDSDNSVDSTYSRNAHRSQRLEFTTIQNLKNNKYDEAVSNLEQMLSVFANQLQNCQRYEEDIKECNANAGTTLHNMGIVQMLNGRFQDSLDLFTRAANIRATCCEDDDLDCIATKMMLGLAHYASEDFASAKKCWGETIALLNRGKFKQSSLSAELLNNLGCVEYETGNEAKAIKHFESSLKLQRRAIISAVYDHSVPSSKHMMMKLAITQANIAYAHLRLKDADAAIPAFAICQQDLDVFLDDHHPFSMAVIDYLALSYLMKADKNNAIKMYSKMLTAQINFHGGGDNIYCDQTLTKLNMLQVKKKKKKTIRAFLKKIQEFIENNNDPCQYERLLKLLKMSGIIFL